MSSSSTRSTTSYKTASTSGEQREARGMSPSANSRINHRQEPTYKTDYKSGRQFEYEPPYEPKQWCPPPSRSEMTDRSFPRKTIRRDASGKFILPDEGEGVRPPVPPKDGHRRDGSGASVTSPLRFNPPTPPAGHRRFDSREGLSRDPFALHGARSSKGSLPPERDPFLGPRRAPLGPDPFSSPKPSQELPYDPFALKSRIDSTDSLPTDSLPKRPGSATSGKFSIPNPFSRRDSNTSNSSQRPSSRRGSSTSLLRRASNELTKDLAILRMTPSERKAFLSAEKLRMEEDLESSRQTNPLSRPQYQRDYLLHHPSPTLDDSSRYLAQDFAIHSKNDSAKYEALAERNQKVEMRRGERAAFFLSRAADVFKTAAGRKGSEDSDAGMDFADVGAEIEEQLLEACKRCGKPTSEWLIKGFCRECHALRVKEFWDAESTPTPGEEYASWYGDSARSSYFSSASSSPSKPRPVNEEDYMKIARDHRIRRVRQTIYEDPGNPFAFPEAEIGIPFSTHDRRGSSVLHAPTPLRAGTPNLIRQHKHSESAPVTSKSPPEEDMDEEGEYIPPRSFWTKPRRGKSLPANQLRKQEAEKRDSRFYQFWKSVWREYTDDEDRDAGMI